MKTVVSVLLVSLIGLVGLVVLLTASASANALFTTILASEALEQPEDAYVVYYYQESCVHCQAIKDEMGRFAEEYQETIGLYAVDMADAKNPWGDEPSYDLEEIETSADISITGTPTIIYVKNGEVVEYNAGSDGVISVLNTIATEYGGEANYVNPEG